MRNVRRYLYANELADALVRFAEDHLPDLRTATVGGLDILPEPERVADWLPAFFVVPGPIRLQFTGQETILVSSYEFTCIYLRPYRFQDPPEDVIRATIEDLQKLAEAMLDDITLGGLTLERAHVLAVVPSMVTYEAEITEVFRELSVPAAAGTMVVEAAVRTLHKHARG